MKLVHVSFYLHSLEGCIFFILIIQWLFAKRQFVVTFIDDDILNEFDNHSTE